MELKQSNLWREIHEEPDAIANCLSVNLPAIKKIAQEVKKRNIRTVVFAGRGSSDHANQVGKYLFETYCGMIASVAAPSVLTCYAGNVDYSNTLLIGVSQSGCAKDLAYVMEKAVAQKALVVSVVNERKTLMSKIGTYRLNNECGPETSITAAKSYLTQTAILTALAAEISQDKTLIKAVQQLSETVRYALTMEKQVRSMIPLIRNSDHLMLFGRGLMYALIQETELKIQETSYLDARCYASSDYQHGPIATVNPFVPCLMFIADKKTNESSLQLLERLQNKHVFSILVTNQKEIAEKGDASILFNRKYDGINAVFVGAVISQMIACLLSVSRGFNPDNPVDVSKHTVTF